jgi:hypothetical protein
MIGPFEKLHRLIKKAFQSVLLWKAFKYLVETLSQSSLSFSSTNIIITGSATVVLSGITCPP